MAFDTDAIDCPLCGNIRCVTYVEAAADKPAPFCGGCHRRLPVLEVRAPRQPIRATIAERIEAHEQAA